MQKKIYDMRALFFRMAARFLSLACSVFRLVPVRAENTIVRGRKFHILAPRCGAPLSCPRCGAPLSCPRCGAPLSCPRCRQNGAATQSVPAVGVTRVAYGRGLFLA